MTVLKSSVTSMSMIVLGLIAMSAPAPVAMAQRPAVKSAKPLAAGQEGAQHPAPTFILQASVHRVIVDVVVTDADGRPVTDLPEDDFHVTEDSKPQQIRYFAVQSSSSAPSYIPPKIPPLPANTFIDLPREPVTGPLTVILYDVLNTPLNAQPFARQQLIRFLRHKPQGSRVAIFALTDRLHLLQGFTADEDRLVAAINRRATLQSSTTLDSSAANESRQNTLDELQPAETAQSGAVAPKSDPSLTETLARLKESQQMEGVYMLQRRERITLEAFHNIARYLTGIPGRKNLLWLSGSFPLATLLDQYSEDPRVPLVNFGAAIRKAMAQATAGRVAIYPVDIRGLMVDAELTAASDTDMGKPNAGPPRYAQELARFEEKQASEDATLETVAENSGGRAFYNSNGLAQAFSEAVTDGSNFYTLTYEPTNENYNGRLRHIHITLSVPGYHLSYRRSYYAMDVDVASSTKEKADETGKESSGSEVPSSAGSAPPTLVSAMQYGAPIEHGLIFVAHIAPLGEPIPATASVLQKLGDFDANARAIKRAKKRPVMLQRYLIHCVVLGSQLHLPLSPDGLRRDTFNLAVSAYNNDGQTLDGILTTVSAAFGKDRYKAIRGGAYGIEQVIAAPVAPAGERSIALRIAISDASSQQVGSLEVPLPLAQVPARAGK